MQSRRVILSSIGAILCAIHWQRSEAADSASVPQSATAARDAAELELKERRSRCAYYARGIKRRFKPEAEVFKAARRLGGCTNKLA